MPQGSVLGPILFTLYTTPLGAIARKYQLNFHLYADDKQLYMAFKPNNAESLPLVIRNIKNCVIDIKSRMAAKMFQLNMHKTEVLLLMNKRLRNPKIDYCNSLLYGIPDKLLNRIQRIQNYAARVVLRLYKLRHITPALARLHWLQSIVGLISRSHCWFTKPWTVKPQSILQISCSPMIHPGSCARLTSNSFHTRNVVWNHIVTVRSAVQPQLYGTISVTVWRLSRLLIILKWN